MAETKVASATTPVKMADGTIVNFAGKRKMIKSSTISPEGEVVIRMDFSNGEYRTYNLVDTLLHRFAAHGAEQKIGDEIAGVEDVEDCVTAIDELLVRLEAGNWNVKRESGATAGGSILAKALMELTGKSKDDITKFLSGKSHAEKIALRTNAKLRPIIDKLEAEKNARGKKKQTVDSDALLAGLDDGPVADEQLAA